VQGQLQELPLQVTKRKRWEVGHITVEFLVTLITPLYDLRSRAQVPEQSEFTRSG